MHAVEIALGVADRAVAASGFPADQLGQRSMQADEEHIERLKQSRHPLDPAGRIEDMLDNEVVPSLGVGAERSVKALEECRPHVAPREFAALDPRARKHPAIAQMV